jgi:phage-related protein
MSWACRLLQGRQWECTGREIPGWSNSEAARQARWTIKTLKEYGIALPFPYSSQVKGQLRELRTQQGKTRLRILYFADVNREFQLLHGVVKDTQKLEQSDINIAEENIADHNQRLKKSKKNE